MGLSTDLLALGALVEPPELEWGEPEPAPAWLCPRLRTTYSPRVAWRNPAGPGADAPGGRPEWSRVWEPGPPAPALGLSLAPNSKRPPRYGLQGMPAAGRKFVWRALALLEEMRPLLSFWTISLPTESLIGLSEADSLPTFQDRVRKELSRLLRAAGLPDLVVGVAELQPARSRAAGMPCPHWHIVFQGRRDKRSPWALSKAQLDGVIAAALASAGVRGPDLRAAGNVQQVRRSVRAYLAKYMTKGSGDTSRWIGSAWEALIPRRWWFATRACRFMTLRHVLPMALGFIAWVHEHRDPIAARGLARFRQIDLSDPRAPATWEVNWIDCPTLARLIGLWHVDLWESEWLRQYNISQWRP